jgi:hypothetical protein
VNRREHGLEGKEEERDVGGEAVGDGDKDWD